MKRLILLVLTIGFLTASAYAHNGMIHVMGTVTAVTDSSISVKGAGGEITTIALAPTTRFVRGATEVAAKDIKVGDHTVVHATGKGTQLVAAEVKLGALKRSSRTDGMSGMKMQHRASTTSH